jgi:hypothetical protein
MPKPLMICLIILLTSSLILFVGCASSPEKGSSFDGTWEFIAIPGYPVRACLNEKDVIKLKTVLNQCGAQDGKSR